MSCILVSVHEWTGLRVLREKSSFLGAFEVITDFILVYCPFFTLLSLQLIH